jgi:hypothetical protein
MRSEPVWLPDSPATRPLVPAYPPRQALTIPANPQKPAAINQNRPREPDDPTPRKSRLTILHVEKRALCSWAKRAYLCSDQSAWPRSSVRAVICQRARSPVRAGRDGLELDYCVHAGDGPARRVLAIMPVDRDQRCDVSLGRGAFYGLVVGGGSLVGAMPFRPVVLAA